MNYTPIDNQDDKLDIMEHINQEHLEEVLVITQAHYPNYTINQAYISDIFVEGIMVEANTSQAKKQLFVRFELQGDLEEQILYLAYMAMSKQGKDLTGNKKHYFEVIEKQQLTPNIARLTLKSQTALPTNYAGYAYGMMLKVLNQMPEKSMREVTQYSLIKKLSNQAFLWVLKKLSSDKRQKVVATINKDIRLYTLRKAWANGNSHFYNHAYMDIFTHGNSAGSIWTQSLKRGDVVFSRTETDDKHSHLNTGKTILIADETAYPALAGILDFWSNPQAPYIIILSQNEAEQAYFIDEEFPNNSIIHRLILPVAQQEVAVINLLKSIEKIEGAWGACENNIAKGIRHYLRNERGLTGKNNHIKGYWNNQKIT